MFVMHLKQGLPAFIQQIEKIEFDIYLKVSISLIKMAVAIVHSLNLQMTPLIWPVRYGVFIVAIVVKMTLI